MAHIAVPITHPSVSPYVIDLYQDYFLFPIARTATTILYSIFPIPPDDDLCLSSYQTIKRTSRGLKEILKGKEKEKEKKH